MCVLVECLGTVCLQDTAAWAAALAHEFRNKMSGMLDVARASAKEMGKGDCCQGL